MFKKLSVIIPVYNEEKTIVEVIRKVCSVRLINSLDKEVIIVNDGSNDDTHLLTTKAIEQYSGVEIRYLHNRVNSGKGFAIRQALSVISGEYVIIQDADLEYSPSDFNTLLRPIVEGAADVVYGARFGQIWSFRKKLKLHILINWLISKFFSYSAPQKISDVETCYKLIPSSFLKKHSLTENGFGIELEISYLIAKSSLRFSEVPIVYKRRTYKEGKKIRLKDGIHAIRYLLNNIK